MAPRSLLAKTALTAFLIAAAPALVAADNGSTSASAAAPTTLISAASASQPTASSTTNAGTTKLITTKIDLPAQPPGGSAPVQPFSGPAWLPNGANLQPALTPQQQAGDSPLGLPNAPRLGGPLPGPPGQPGLPFGPIPPWVGGPGPGNASQACKPIDPNNMPNTGQTRKYSFDVSYKTIAPDGVSKEGLVINGAYPGPTIEANWGDWVEVTVHNTLGGTDTPEGVSIHWHGLLQRETPFSDGVPSVTQCPIAPGDTFTYRFRADQYGTSWYHSHYSAQYSSGAYGAMVIHGPNDTPECLGYDEDIGPVLIGDWYHQRYYALVQETFSATGAPPQSQSNLVNGRGNYPCQKTTLQCTPNAGLSKFKFEKGKKYRMRLINPSSEATQKISIDQHKFTIVANDYVPIVPVETDLITLGVGQRTDVIVEATGDADKSYWFRSTLDIDGSSCSLTDGINNNATAVVYYQDADPNAVPTSTFDIAASRILDCDNDPLSSSVPSWPMSADVQGSLWTQVMNIDFVNNGTDFVWTVNNISARVDYNVPQLADVVTNTLKVQPEFNLYTMPDSDTTARIIMYNSFPFSTHPMHLHGHNYQVLAVGQGTWDGSITNANNPARRDVYELPKASTSGERGYLVIQFPLNNPTINILHCHIAWHVSAGLYTALIEHPDAIRQTRTVPQNIKQVCSNWDAWTNRDVPDQIDSGV